MRCLVLIPFLLVINNLAFAETIKLKSGKIIEGRIVELTDNQVVVDREGPDNTWRINFDMMDAGSLKILNALPKVSRQVVDPLTQSENQLKNQIATIAVPAEDAVGLSLEDYVAQKVKKYSIPLKDSPDVSLNDFISKLRVYVSQNFSTEDVSKEIYRDIANIALGCGIIYAINGDSRDIDDINEYLRKYGLFLEVGVISEDTVSHFAIRLAHMKSRQPRVFNVPLLNKDATFEMILLENFYIDTNPSTTAFVSVPEGHNATPIIYCNIDSLNHWGTNIFFSVFDWFRIHGIDIAQNPFLTDENIYGAEGDQAKGDVNLIVRLERKWLYRAWRDLYVETVTKYDQEEQQVIFFVNKFTEVQIPEHINHEATHLVQDIHPPVSAEQSMMLEFFAFANTLFQSDAPFVTLSSLSGISAIGMLDDSKDPGPHSLAAFTLLDLLAKSYNKFRNQLELIYDENTVVDKVLSSLDGIDHLSNEELRTVIKILKKDNFTK